MGLIRAIDNLHVKQIYAEDLTDILFWVGVKSPDTLLSGEVLALLHRLEQVKSSSSDITDAITYYEQLSHWGGAGWVTEQTLSEFRAREKNS